MFSRPLGFPFLAPSHLPCFRIIDHSRVRFAAREHPHSLPQRLQRSRRRQRLRRRVTRERVARFRIEYRPTRLAKVRDYQFTRWWPMISSTFFFRFQDHIPPEEMSLSHQMAALNCHDCFRVVLEHWLVIARSKVTLLPLSHKSSWCVPYLSPSPSLTRTVSLPRHVRLIEQFLAFLIQALNRVRSAVELDSFTNVEPYLKHSTSAIDTTSCFYQVGVLRQRQRERESFKLQIKGDSLSLCTGRLRTVRP